MDEIVPARCPVCRGSFTWLFTARAGEANALTCETGGCPNNWTGRMAEARTQIDRGGGTLTVAVSAEPTYTLAEVRDAFANAPRSVRGTAWDDLRFELLKLRR